MARLPLVGGSLDLELAAREVPLALLTKGAFLAAVEAAGGQGTSLTPAAAVGASCRLIDLGYSQRT